MQIGFHNVRDDRDQRHKSEVTILEAEKVRGRLEIHFQGDEPKNYELPDVSVPLIVAEAKLFLARLRKHGHATWRLFFAHFLDGKFENGSICLMEGSGDHLSGRLVEVLTPDRIEHLEAELERLERRYGRLSPSPDALDTPH